MRDEKREKCAFANDLRPSRLAATQSGALAWSVVAILFVASQSTAADSPPLKDFLGVCGHTVLFRPALYRPAVGFVRDYHPMDWDTGSDPSTPTTFPFAKNRVHWETVYGSWKKEKFDVNVCVMFDVFKPEVWKNPSEAAEKYGEAFAKAFGPSSKLPYVSSVEIGNEPGLYDDAMYRKIFEGMAKGLRNGDPKIKIATCAMVVGKSHRYAKSVDCVKGLESLYDVLTMHTYAEKEPWPTFKRSYPEDPTIKYLKDVKAVQDWRDANAPGKPVWVTEFGWDASTKKPPTTGDFAKWVGNTEAQQADWLVRSTLLFMKMKVDRAYVYFFNDDDAPHMHGSAGLTRKFVPKPAFHALANLQRILGDCRFEKVVHETPGRTYVYEFVKTTGKPTRVWAAWAANGKVDLGVDAPVQRDGEATGEVLQHRPGAPMMTKVPIKGGTASMLLGESPIFITWKVAR